jgi:hypothetical protein
MAGAVTVSAARAMGARRRTIVLKKCMIAVVYSLKWGFEWF